MKKLYLLSLLLPLWSIAEATVQVKSISADYANKRVTFALSWAAGTRDATHNSKVWVFVDYQPVTNPNTTGAWQRATVVSASATAGTVSYDGSNRQGFYLQGADGVFSSTVTVTLSGVPAKFNWCATATDYPPQATVTGNQDIILKGTPPFTVIYADNSTTVTSSKQYRLPPNKSVKSFADATFCPGNIQYEYANCLENAVSFGSIGFTTAQTWVVGSQTWSAPVTATYCNKTSYRPGSSAPYNAECRANTQASYGHLFNACMVARYANQLCPSPWRVPNVGDFEALDRALGGTGSTRVDATTMAKYLCATPGCWGGALVGHATAANNLGATHQGIHAFYMGATAYGPSVCSLGIALSFQTTNAIQIHAGTCMGNGAALRCVRNI